MTKLVHLSPIYLPTLRLLHWRHWHHVNYYTSEPLCSLCWLFLKWILVLLLSTEVQQNNADLQDLHTMSVSCVRKWSLPSDETLQRSSCEMFSQSCFRAQGCPSQSGRRHKFAGIHKRSVLKRQLLSDSQVVNVAVWLGFQVLYGSARCQYLRQLNRNNESDYYS